MKYKARTIKLCEDPFEEELLPYQTLLHIYFADRAKNFYRWTPRIRDGEVERILFKMVEVEEKNSPQGVWSDELNRAAKQIPKLKRFKLPVKVTYGGLEEMENEENEKWRYKITIEILGDETSVTKDKYGEGFYIGECYLKMTPLFKGVMEKSQRNWGLGFSKRCYSIIEGDYPLQQETGVCFNIWIEKRLERLDYQIIAREVTGAIRSYIRGIFLDSKAFQKGFEET